MEERPPVWSIAANVLNKQSWTADKEWSQGLVVGRELWTPQPKMYHLTKHSQKPRTQTNPLLSSWRCVGVCECSKVWGLSLVAQLLIASQEGLCPMEMVNLLQATGYVMHQQFNIQQLYVLPTLYLCVLYLSENKQRLVSLTA